MYVPGILYPCATLSRSEGTIAFLIHSISLTFALVNHPITYANLNNWFLLLLNFWH